MSGCPVCGWVAGFHNPAAHRHVDPKYWKPKGWMKL